MNDFLSPTAIDTEQAIGQIAVQLPGATAVFRRHRLDFCCSGQSSLRQACADRRVELQTVIDELATLQRSRARPAAVAPSDLIDHILKRYHDVHRVQLPELIRMARRVEAVHRDNPLTPAGLADALQAMEQELLAHMHKEEAVLFPMLRTGGNAFVPQPIAMMRLEHLEHGETLERLAQLTDDMTAPAGACNTWRALYTGLAQLRDDLIDHIHLENNVLFPQFEQPAGTQACGGGGGSGCGCSG